jgi:hypothetical protein
VKEPLVAEGYAQLIKALGNPALRDGDFHRCAVRLRIPGSHSESWAHTIGNHGLIRAKARIRP